MLKTYQVSLLIKTSLSDLVAFLVLAKKRLIVVSKALMLHKITEM